MFRILLLMTIIPTIEILLMFDVHDWFAAHWGADVALLATVGVTLVTGLVGARLAKQQGFKIISDAQEQLAQGQVPGSSLVEGAMVLVGGVLLVTPGYFTDLLGFLLVFPGSRALIRQRFVTLLGRTTRVSYVRTRAPNSWEQQRPSHVRNENILDVEAIDI